MSHPWTPSNSTDGHAFEQAWCALCLHDKAYRNAGDEAAAEDSCDILAAAVCGEQVTAWVEDENGPRCTAFQWDPERLPADDRTADMFGETA